IGQVGQVIMGLVDNAMVGKLGPAELSAVGIANAIYFFIFVFGIGLMVSISTLVSNYLSQNKLNLIGELFKNTLYSALIASIAINIVMYIVIRNIDLFRFDTEVAKLATKYLLLILPGTPFLI